MTERARVAWCLSRLFGPPKAAEILVRRSLRHQRAIKARCAYGNIDVRVGDSDLFVAVQTFQKQEYAIDAARQAKLNALAKSWRAEGATPVIIDAGANVGYSAIYLAKTYPDALVIAVEPDPACVEQIRRNCASLPNVVQVLGAVWKHNDGVHLQGADEPSWARTVGEGGATPSFTIKALLAMAPNARPLVLKMDIEGAEREVCDEAVEELANFPCILIEPHDFIIPGGSCLQALYAALAKRRMDTLINGENLILFDSKLAAS